MIFNSIYGETVEIIGIPVTSQDNPKSIAMEVGNLMGVRVEENDISTSLLINYTFII